MNILGIDLGTTFCAVSKINEIGKAEIVPFSDGERLMRSAVMIGDDVMHFGEQAKNNYGNDPQQYFDLVKRYIDREYYPEVDENNVPIEGKNRLLNGQPVKTVYLQSLILKKIKDDFESRYGKIDKAIITVPAYFDEVRRNATYEAALLAGLPVEGLLNEPTSAGIYYANNFSHINGKNLIFDLGGGTFDVSIIDVSRNGNKTDVDVISTLGDHELGGKDFDYEIFKEQINVYTQEKNADLFEADDQTEKFELLSRCEGIKKHLSENDVYDKRLQGTEGNIKFNLRRDKFEELIGIYIQKVEMLVESLLDETKIAPSEINDVILVGGSSRIPVFKQYLAKTFGKEPLIMGNVDESVALGASLECLRRASETGTLTDVNSKIKNAAKDIIVSDITAHSYGVVALAFDENSGSRMKENVFIIPRNSKIPANVKKSFFLVSDDQTAVSIQITQGESHEIDAVNVVHEGEFDLSGVVTFEGDEVVVEYSYDINGMMHCTFLHTKSKKQYVVKINI